MVHDTKNLPFPQTTMHVIRKKPRSCPHMSTQTISGFYGEQLANFGRNSVDAIRSRTDVLRLFVFTEIARIIPS